MFERVVVVTGMPRSGTSWVGQIVESCPAVRYKMSPLFSYEFKNAVREGACREDWEQLFRDVYETSGEFLDQTHRRKLGEYPSFVERMEQPPVLALKFNRFQNLVEELLMLFPEMRMVSVVRHPCGAIHSWLTAPSEFPLHADPLMHWRSGAVKKSGYGDYFGFDDWKWVTRLHVRLAKERPGQFRIERYEHLVERPLEGARRILRFLDLPFTAQTRGFVRDSHKKMVPGDYSVFKSPAVKDRWRYELNPEIRQAIIEELVGSDLEEFIR
jgi:hypothetical protein